MCVRATDICLFAMHYDHINLPIAVCFLQGGHKVGVVYTV